MQSIRRKMLAWRSKQRDMYPGTLSRGAVGDSAVPGCGRVRGWASQPAPASHHTRKREHELTTGDELALTPLSQTLLLPADSQQHHSKCLLDACSSCVYTRIDTLNWNIL